MAPSSATTARSRALRARTFEVLDFAYEAGVRDFDVARSYGRGEEFLGEWLRSRNPSGVHRLLQVGLRLHRGLGGRPRPARGQAPRPRDVPAPAQRDARAPGRVAEALPDPLGHARERRAGRRRGAGARCRRPTCRSACRSAAPRQAETIDLALDARALRRRPGDLEPARARGRATALARAHAAGLKVIVKEALANGRLPTRRRVALGRRARPAVGRRSSSAARRRSTSCAPTCAPATPRRRTLGRAGGQRGLLGAPRVARPGTERHRHAGAARRPVRRLHLAAVGARRAGGRSPARGPAPPPPRALSPR